MGNLKERRSIREKKKNPVKIEGTNSGKGGLRSMI